MASLMFDSRANHAIFPMQANFFQQVTIATTVTTLSITFKEVPF